MIKCLKKLSRRYWKVVILATDKSEILLLRNVDEFPFLIYSSFVHSKLYKTKPTFLSLYCLLPPFAPPHIFNTKLKNLSRPSLPFSEKLFPVILYPKPVCGAKRRRLPQVPFAFFLLVKVRVSGLELTLSWTSFLNVSVASSCLKSAMKNIISTFESTHSPCKYS